VPPATALVAARLRDRRFPGGGDAVRVLIPAPLTIRDRIRPRRV